MTSTRSFDTEVASSGYATGFIVDSVRGLILTNRHVVKPGPVVAEAVFLKCVRCALLRCQVFLCLLLQFSHAL